jgi:ADP-ribose pyrophosphatase
MGLTENEHDESMHWKILESEYLFNETWLTIRKDICETPKGNIINPYYVYEFPTWVSALAITEEGQVVMVRQYRHGIQETILETPGGCVDDADLNHETAIARELVEETGFVFKNYYYLGQVSPNPSTNTNFIHMFLATGGVKTAEQQLDHNEEIEVELHSVEALKKLVAENRIVQAMHLCTIMYGLNRLEEISPSRKV